jgi:hypothetical protein
MRDVENISQIPRLNFSQLVTNIGIFMVYSSILKASLFFEEIKGRSFTPQSK